jgi:phosphoribosylaminoimidazole-succinocarboxamide synthase
MKARRARVKALRKLYEGKAKIVYETADPDLLILHFKDNGEPVRSGRRRASAARRGVYNAAIAAAIFQYLEEAGVATHYVGTLSDRKMLVKRLQIIPIEVAVRNIVAGSLAGRLGLEVGLRLDSPVLEFSYKSDALGDPMINESHVRVLGIATPEELVQLRELAFRVNGLLLPYFERRDLLLVDLKLEFGRHKGQLLLGDEITPDGCRFWDRQRLERSRAGGVPSDRWPFPSAHRRLYQRIVGN